MKKKEIWRIEIRRFRAVKLLVIFSLLFTLHSSLIAGDEGTTAAQFLKIALNPRMEGMGGTGAAFHADDIFYNPASISRMSKISARAGYVSWFESISKANVFCAVPLGRNGWKFAGNISYFSVAGLKEYSSSASLPSDSSGAFDRNSYSVSAAFARDFGKLSVGLSLKGIYEIYESENGNAVAVDAGFIFNLLRKISLAAVIQNAGTKLGIAGVDKKLPQNTKFGFGFQPTERFKIGFDLDQPNDSETRQHFGFETEFAKNYFLRAGYQKFGEVSGLTFGFGMDFLTSGFAGRPELMTASQQKIIVIDYSYQSNSEFDSIHRFSIGVKF
ncbi:MAG: PorV/PorQ family protein [Elusimicrobia bacterium]|nr:PorV/PorQ family protein [Elusimicrobiota bacterium]